MPRFRLETEVVNMDFFELSGFDTNHAGAVVRFEILPESYQQWWMSAFDVPAVRERCLSTGKTTVLIEAPNPQKAMDHGITILHDYEQPLTLAHEVESFYKLRNGVVHNRNEELEGVDLGEKTFRFMRLLQKLLFRMSGIYKDSGAFKSPVKSQDLSAR